MGTAAATASTSDDASNEAVSARTAALDGPAVRFERGYVHAPIAGSLKLTAALTAAPAEPLGGGAAACLDASTSSAGAAAGPAVYMGIIEPTRRL